MSQRKRKESKPPSFYPAVALFSLSAIAALSGDARTSLYGLGLGLLSTLFLMVTGAFPHILMALLPAISSLLAYGSLRIVPAGLAPAEQLPAMRAISFAAPIYLALLLAQGKASRWILISGRALLAMTLLLVVAKTPGFERALPAPLMVYSPAALLLALSLYFFANREKAQADITFTERSRMGRKLGERRKK